MSEKSSNSRHTDRISMRVPCQLNIGQTGSSDVVRRPAGGSGCYLVNLSDTGMQISTNILLREDVKLSAELRFEKENRSVSFSFKVKWLRKNSYKAFGSYSYGIQFIQISDSNRDFLHQIYKREKDNLEKGMIIKD